MRNQKNITDRKGLKESFKNGQLPDEKAFTSLIDSTFNIADDKLDINEDGLMIYPSENEKGKLLSFFEDRDDQKATWALYTSNKPNKGISINKITEEKQADNSVEEGVEAPAIFIQKEGGKVGLGTNFPRQQMDVTGIIASQGRMGTFIESTVKADGNWHNIFDNEKGLSACNAFEIVAYAEREKKAERFSLLHAIAISTFGHSKSKISKTIAHSGKWWNKIELRWQSRLYNNDEKKFVTDRNSWFGLSFFWKSLTGKITSRNRDKYNLQIRTKSNYGDSSSLYVRVSVLWNSDFKKGGNTAG